MNIINAAFVRNGVTVRTLPVYQYNRGMILQISGLDDLPTTFRVDFANTETGQSKTVIGTDGQVHIPYEYFVPGVTIHCWLVWTGADYTVTRKHIMIPVARRATPTDEEPTPDEQGVIDQAIAALNDAVTHTGQDVETVAGYAEQAEQSAQAATDAQDVAVAAKDRAVQSATNAAELAQSAFQSKADASASAQSASESAQSASQSKTAAQEAAASVAGAMDTLEATIQADLQAAKESGEFDGADGVSPTVTVTPITDGHQVMITDAEGEHTFDVTDGEPGADGFSPIATVTQTQTGSVITVTDKTGTTTATVTNGAKGDPGTPGTDGFSPVATVTQTQTGATISITDKAGTTTAQISNGRDGEPGTPGTDGISPSIAVTDITGGHRVTITDATGSHSFDVLDGDVADAPVQDVQVNGTSILDAQGVANVPAASTQTMGVVTIGNGLLIAANKLAVMNAVGYIKPGTISTRFLTPSIQHESTFYGLTKAAGVDMASSSNPVGTYTDAAKVAIQKMLGIYEAPWELIREDTFTNETEANHIITTDANGEPFELSDLILILWVPSQNNTAIIGDFGRVFFRNGNTNIRCVYLTAISVPANSNIRVAIARLTQNNGLMSVSYAEWINRNNHQNIHVTAAEDKNGYGTPFGLNDTPINSISINAVTGTMGYRLLGKRKWQ